MDLFEKMCEILSGCPKGNEWSNGDEILCKTQNAADTVADLLEKVSECNGEEILLMTGYYDPKGDARSNESDELSGWYYIKAD